MYRKMLILVLGYLRSMVDISCKYLRLFILCSFIVGLWIYCAAFIVGLWIYITDCRKEEHITTHLPQLREVPKKPCQFRGRGYFERSCIAFVSDYHHSVTIHTTLILDLNPKMWMEVWKETWKKHQY